ncbi:MAG: hypothetical protein ACM3ZE_09955, partial [Myxococcales bacterium]
MTGARASGGRASGGSTASGKTVSGGAGGSSVGGTGSTGASSAVGGAMSCDTAAPPSNVAAWIDESWNAEGKNNMSWHSTWVHDAAMKGHGQLNICVRYGATRAVSAATRDLVAPAMQRWFNQWFAKLYPYDCFPYPAITVKITGWAVKPGLESLLRWTDRDVPVYTEVYDGADQAKGEPKCPDSCGFFFHPDHAFANCPGGAANHFDYTLWLNDKLPSGAAAEGSDWGVRIPVETFMGNINVETLDVMLHEIGHGFGLSDYYNWKGSTPAGGSVMVIGSARGLTVGSQWMVRRYWKETKLLR